MPSRWPSAPPRSPSAPASRSAVSACATGWRAARRRAGAGAGCSAARARRRDDRAGRARTGCCSTRAPAARAWSRSPRSRRSPGSAAARRCPGPGGAVQARLGAAQRACAASPATARPVRMHLRDGSRARRDARPGRCRLRRGGAPCGRRAAAARRGARRACCVPLDCPGDRCSRRAGCVSGRSASSSVNGWLATNSRVSSYIRAM